MLTTAKFYLMSSDSTELVEQSLHYAYLIIRIFPGNVPTGPAVLCHYGETNGIFCPGGLVELSSSRCKTVQTFMLVYNRGNLWDFTSTKVCTVLHRDNDNSTKPPRKKMSLVLP